jgi:hypothetical protein
MLTGERSVGRLRAVGPDHLNAEIWRWATSLEPSLSHAISAAPGILPLAPTRREPETIDISRRTEATRASALLDRCIVQSMSKRRKHCRQAAFSGSREFLDCSNAFAKFAIDSLLRGPVAHSALPPRAPETVDIFVVFQWFDSGAGKRVRRPQDVSWAPRRTSRASAV